MIYRTYKEGEAHGFYIYEKTVDTYQKASETRDGGASGYSTEYYV